jgi:hypothetical protein
MFFPFCISRRQDGVYDQNEIQGRRDIVYQVGKFSKEIDHPVKGEHGIEKNDHARTFTFFLRMAVAASFLANFSRHFDAERVQLLPMISRVDATLFFSWGGVPSSSNLLIMSRMIGGRACIIFSYPKTVFFRVFFFFTLGLIKAFFLASFS